MTLYEFYGDECPHCKNMDSKVEQLEEDEDVKVEKNLKSGTTKKTLRRWKNLMMENVEAFFFSTTQKAKNGSVGKQILKL